MNQTRNSNQKEIMTWRERYGHLPWFRRFEFLGPAIVILLAAMFFLLPGKTRIQND